jgi:CspA family cold shock protein
MVRGKIRWFSQAKGFGFIRPFEGDDVYFHYTAIRSRRIDALQEGQDVEFDILDTGRGLEASNVSLVEYR